MKLPRSTAYYKPVEVSEATLKLMRHIDKLHLQHPYAGSRMLRDFLRQDEYNRMLKNAYLHSDFLDYDS